MAAELTSSLGKYKRLGSLVTLPRLSLCGMKVVNNDEKWKSFTIFGSYYDNRRGDVPPLLFCRSHDKKL